MSKQVTIELINELRQKTGAGISLCKEALIASDASVESAMEWLRKRHIKPDTLTRKTGEGLVKAKVSDCGKKAICFSLQCETDFAAKNPRFLKLAEQVAHDLLEYNFIKEETVQDINAEIATGMKENITVGKHQVVMLAGIGSIGSYIHSNGKLIALVGVNCQKEATLKAPEFMALIKDLAMHVAGANPTPEAPDRETLSPDLVDKEHKFILGQLNADTTFAKKPPNIQQKIVEGKMGRFYQEKVLLEQPFVKDENKNVFQYIKEQAKKLNDDLTVAWFVRHQLGA